MISGALKSINLLNRLFLLITLRYKSFKSDVANLPPSKGTSGRNSGGITGSVVKIIHSALFPDEMNDSISFNLFIVLSSFTFEVIVFNSSRRRSLSASMSRFARQSLIAEAPIPAVNWSSPNSS